MTCKDKVAIVTGAAGKGMGRSIALTLAREGAKVVVNYRTSEQSAQRVAEHIKSRGGDAMTTQGDVFRADDCRRLVDAAIERYGNVDICVIGPGAGWHPEPAAKIDGVAALEDAHNELAPIYHLMPLVLPSMYGRKYGRLIGLSLNRPFDSPAYAYNVAKAARTYALLQARDQAFQHGVTVNIIAPGPVSAIEQFSQAVELCDHGSAWVDRNNTTPQDIAEGVGFLCSEAGSFISGCEVPYRWQP